MAAQSHGSLPSANIRWVIAIIGAEFFPSPTRELHEIGVGDGNSQLAHTAEETAAEESDRFATMMSPRS